MLPLLVETLSKEWEFAMRTLNWYSWDETLTRNGFAFFAVLAGCFNYTMRNGTKYWGQKFSRRRQHIEVADFIFLLKDLCPHYPRLLDVQAGGALSKPV